MAGDRRGVLNLGFIVVFYKELKLATFDAGLAAALGFSPVLIHYALMALVSVTAVSSFEAAGTVLVVALMIAPPAAAYLITDRLPVMLALAAGIGVLAAIGGFGLARALDASIAGSMATMTGVAFLLALLFAPERGLVGKWLRGRRQRWQFAGEMLLVHLLQHEGDPALAEEANVEHMARHMRWRPAFGERVADYLARRGLAARVDGGARLALTQEGRATARDRHAAIAARSARGPLPAGRAIRMHGSAGVGSAHHGRNHSARACAGVRAGMADGARSRCCPSSVIRTACSA